MVDSEKNRIRIRAFNTTPGQWKIDDQGNIFSDHTPDCLPQSQCDGSCGGFTVAAMLDNPNDAKFIVQAREDVTELLTAMEQMEETHERIRDLYHEENNRLREIIAAMQGAMAPLAAVPNADDRMTECMFCGGIRWDGEESNHKDDCPFVLSQKAMTDPNLTGGHGVSDGGGWDDFMHGVGPDELAKEA